MQMFIKEQGRIKRESFVFVRTKSRVERFIAASQKASFLANTWLFVEYSQNIGAEKKLRVKTDQSNLGSNFAIQFLQKKQRLER